MQTGRSRVIDFSLGAAIGAALGLILGSLLTYWIGDETIRALRSGMAKTEDQPNFEKLLQ
jgi:uncharacterized membrane protein